ncbi:DUF4432 family protein [Tenggerimyces flavus]|uniref:DUF4432 family protein n=1 Tax=Tenggerimyces flavus TaxID=1708749 RepID=A0ABV7YP96_9ACTN|nr:DUF4432 family protein [Tenggerimyces flavus]MBM7786483.1 galactose mutarotase-like enzyme [Tenggerimyces flavus]
MRNWGARVHEIRLQGLRAVVLENELLRVTILADKGTDVVEFNAKREDLDFVWWTADGLRGAPADFFDGYEGGWQEVLPNGGPPVEHRGARFDQHGEVAGLPWDYAIVEDTEEVVSVRFSVRARRVPLHVVKTMTLRSGAAALSIVEEATNESPVPIDAMWGHHLTFGRPFAGPGCEVRLPDGLDVHAHDGAVNPSGVRRLSGDPAAVDWSVLPEPGTPSELLYLTGFGEVGQYDVVDPQRALGLRVRWDATTMPWLWFWQEFGAHRDYPWYGRNYNIGLEPFSSYPSNGLPDAVANGTALVIEPHGTVRNWLEATVVVQDGDWKPMTR